MMTKGLSISWSKVVENDTIIKTVLFIFFAPMIGMAISIFITIVTILRNMWLRMGIIILATALTVLLFDRFEENKMNQGLEKFIKLDKYKLEVAKANEAIEKNSNDDKAKEDLATAEKKLNGAKEIYSKITPVMAQFDKIGADSIASFAYNNGLLADIEVSKLKDDVRNANNFLILESLSADNPEKKKEYDVAKVETEKYKGPVKQLLKKEISLDSALVAMNAIYPIDPANTKKVKSKIEKFNIQSSFKKDIDKI